MAWTSNAWAPVLLTVVLLAVKLQLCDGVPPNNDQIEALRGLKAAWGSQVDLFSWDSNLDCSLWTGLTCDGEGHVTKLDFASLNLTGPIPESISELTTLKTLSLAGNYLTGSIPASMAKLVALENLYLLDNELGGRIPSWITSLPRLTQLLLGSNQFVGHIPADFGASNQPLSIVDMSLNGLTGPIPPTLGLATTLTSVALGNNGLTGTIPESLGNLSNLIQLQLGHNNLTGLIPASLGNLSKLELLSLLENKLVGGIPESFANLVNIKFMSMEKNNLTGSIPDIFANFKQMTTFDVKFNEFTGDVPLSLWERTTLLFLDLRWNNLTGPVPEKIGDMTDIEHLNLAGNHFSGPIPASITSLRKLVTLYLHTNNFTGPLPEDVGNMPVLFLVDVHLNKLTGTIPTSLGNLSGLGIDLSYNNFTGEIPQALTKITKITEIRLNHNSLEGEIPDFSQVASLFQLDLSFNRLRGRVPNNLSSTFELVDFSGNNLTGPLNFSASNGPLSLQHLLLGDNQLSGPIPDLLTLAPNLGLLNLERNNFSSTVPTSLVSSPNIRTLLAGNPVCDSDGSLARSRSAACSAFRAPSAYSKAPVCPTTTCPDHLCPSPHLWITEGRCVCRSAFRVVILFLAPSFRYFDAREDAALREVLAERLQLNFSTQVWIPQVYLGEDLDYRGQLEFYPPSSTPWTLIEIDLLYNVFTYNTSFLRNYFGPHVVLSSEFVPEDVDPGEPVPAAPPPLQDKGGLKVWIIPAAVIPAVTMLLLLLLGGLGYQCGIHRPPIAKGSEDDENFISDLENKLSTHFTKCIPLETIVEATDNFAKDNQLGAGGYGIVYRGESPYGEVWAVKRAKNFSSTNQQRFQKEVDVISKLSHRNLVRLIGYCSEEDEHILVYEFVPNGTLRQRLKARGTPVLTFDQRLEIAVGTANALHYLHTFAKPAIVHRDVKSDNILLDADMQAKVADFGLLKDIAIDAAPGDAMTTRVAGTPGYLDPEYFKTFKVTSKSDVYSFGIVLLELVTGKPPVMEDCTDDGGSSMFTIAKWASPRIEAGKLASVVDPSLGDGVPLRAIEAIAKLALACTQDRSKLRPDMARVASALHAIQRLANGDPNFDPDALEIPMGEWGSMRESRSLRECTTEDDFKGSKLNPETAMGSEQLGLADADVALVKVGLTGVDSIPSLGARENVSSVNWESTRSLAREPIYDLHDFTSTSSEDACILSQALLKQNGTHFVTPFRI